MTTALTRPIASAYDERLQQELAAPMPADGDTPIGDALVRELGDPLADVLEDETREAA